MRKQKELSLTSVKVLISAQTKISEESINNIDGAVMRFTGPPPQVAQFGTVIAELDPHIQEVLNQCYQLTGMSQMYSGSKKEPGVTAAIAMETLFNSQTQRFKQIEDEFTQAVVSGSERLIRRVYEMDKRTKKPLEIYSNNKGILEPITLEDVNFAEGNFRATAFPINPMTRNPASKLDYIEKIMQIEPGLQEHALKLLDFPDLEGIIKSKTSQSRLLELLEEAIIEDKPLPEIDARFMNLKSIMSYMQNSLCNAVVDDMDEEILERFRNFIDVLADEIEQPPAGPMPGPELVGPPMDGIPPEVPPAMPPGVPGGMMPAEPPPSGM